MVHHGSQLSRESLNTSAIIEDLAATPSEQQFCYATIPGGPKGMQTILHYLLRPAAPRERSSDDLQSTCASSVPLTQLWSESLILASGYITLLVNVGSLRW